METKNLSRKLLNLKSSLTFSNSAPTSRRNSSPEEAIEEIHNGSTSGRNTPPDEIIEEIIHTDGQQEKLHLLHSELDNLTRNDVNSDVNDTSSTTWSPESSNKRLQIKRSHWKDVTKAQRCEYISCVKDLRFAFKKYNCRRCGEVFCESCTQYRMRLDLEANPDPYGSPQRVCRQCAGRDAIQDVGQTRSHSDFFLEQRQNKRVNVKNELDRLIAGFESNVDPKSPLKSLVNTLQVLIVPDWQKSSKWVDSAEVSQCTNCAFKFNIISRKYNCRLCGSVYCNKCCHDNLLMFFKVDKKVDAKVIKVIGCPKKEPEVALYLDICCDCQENLIDYQVHEYYTNQAATNTEEGRNKLTKLQTILENLNLLQKKLDVSLPSFQEELETYVFEGHPEKNLNGQKNIDIFAKANSDISGLLGQYALALQGMKDLDMCSDVELKLLQTVITAKCNQYMNSLHCFKNLKVQMEETVPTKMLEEFQRIANKQAINNTYVAIHQLGLEALNLALKYKFETSLAEKLSKLDKVCYMELEVYLRAVGENSKEHLDVLNELVKDQLERKKLVQVDKQLADDHGAEYVQGFLVQRCYSLLSSVLSDLNTRSSEKQFVASKAQFEQVLSFVTDLNNNGMKNRL